MLVAALGWFTAHMFYVTNTELPEQAGRSYAGIRTMLVNKYWVDEIYNAVIVNRGFLFRDTCWARGGDGSGAGRRAWLLRRNAWPGRIVPPHSIGQHSLVCGMAGTGRGGGAADFVLRIRTWRGFVLNKFWQVRESNFAD